MKKQLAIVIHSFYLDILEDLLARISKIDVDFKIYITTPIELEDRTNILLLENNMKYKLLVTENHGHDVYPFLQIMPYVIKAEHEIILKVHTKKSLHNRHGEIWRNDLYNKLLEPINCLKIIDKFNSDSSIGMVGPDGHVLSLEKYAGVNIRWILKLSELLGFRPIDVLDSSFVAGTMFYARVSCIKPIIDSNIDKDTFDNEEGQTDGLAIHALERLFGASVMLQGQKILNTSLKEPTTVELNKTHRKVLKEIRNKLKPKITIKKIKEFIFS